MRKTIVAGVVSAAKRVRYSSRSGRFYVPRDALREFLEIVAGPQDPSLRHVQIVAYVNKRIDVDNIAKTVLDALYADDSVVIDLRVRKFAGKDEKVKIRLSDGKFHRFYKPRLPKRKRR